ncbi:unnamed protein product, partial [marine sediment metagenome]
MPKEPAYEELEQRVRDLEKEALERKRAEEDLKLHGEILENMVEGVNVSDEKGIILFTNPNFDSMFGYNRGELIRKSVSALNNLSPEENARFVAEVIKQLKTKGSWFGEASNIKKDGTPLTTYVRVSALEVSDKLVLVSVQENITERKHAEEELKKYREHLEELVEERTRKLEEANTELESFTYSVSHDLRAPSRAMQGFSQALLEDCAYKLDAEGKEYGQRIVSSAQRMETLIQDLLG